MACAAMNCSNRHPLYKMKRFPKDATLRRTWIHNCGRKDFHPSPSSFICEVHFEDNQFESERKGERKLKKSAISTLFQVPNAPKKFVEETRKSKYKKLNDSSNGACGRSTLPTNDDVTNAGELNSNELKSAIKELDSQSRTFKVGNQSLKELYEKFLSYVEAEESERSTNPTCVALRDVCSEIHLLRRENAQIRSNIKKFTDCIDNQTFEDKCTREVIQDIQGEIDQFKTQMSFI